MNEIELLKAARAKIANPENWTQGVAARDKRSRVTCPQSRLAVCWCSLGALRSVSEGETAVIDSAMSALYPHMDGCVPVFNDSHTHAEVLAAWDAAIADLEG